MTKYMTVSILLFAAFGCTSLRPIAGRRGGEDTGSNPLVISPSRARVRLNEQTTVRLRSRDLAVSVRVPIVWVSSDPETISVIGASAEAVLTAHKLGRVEITATTADGLSTTAVAQVR